MTARIAARKELQALFDQANRLLRVELDGLMAAFEASQPQFYAEYTNARRIVNTGVRHNNHTEPPPEPPA